jgi:2-keto-3-deoxy-L-rhamnonate aldolase RhmA
VKENRIRRVIREGGTAVGIQVMEFGTRGIAKILETTDLDYAILDMGHSDFRTPKASEYLPFMNQQTLVVTQIETVKGLEHCEEIAAVEKLRGGTGSAH